MSVSSVTARAIETGCMQGPQVREVQVRNQLVWQDGELMEMY
jgi:hypothetical protein